MSRKLAQRRGFWGCETLEARQLLTVSVAINGSDLSLTGTADGAVEVTATDSAGTFDIYDNGVLVQTATGITGNIKVKLDDASGAPDNSLAIDLGAGTVDRVMVDLGDGTNSFTLSDGTVAKSVKYVGGSGNDSVTIADTTAVTQSVFANLGDGDDSLFIDGTIGRGLFVNAGAGDDTVEVSATATIARGAGINLGDGNNQLTITGQIDGVLMTRGGSGDDTLQLQAGADRPLGQCHARWR